MKNKFKNIKVALIAPSNKFLSDPLMSESLGTMYIEGALKKLDINVEMVDMTFSSKLPNADIYGFSASTIHFLECVEYSKQVKGAYTIIGGPHASALPYEAKRFFNAVVVGAGEEAIVKVLNDFVNGGDGGIFQVPIDNIDSIPIPPRTILKDIKYRPFPGVNASATLITSRGCPYKCSFCASSAIWGCKVQFRSAEKVIAEIEYLEEKFGIRHFKFVDDIFTLNRPRFQNFCGKLKKLDIKWVCETRVDSIDDEMLDQMVRSGCEYVNLGIESVSDVVLKKNYKQQTSKQMKAAISKIKSRGLKVKLYLIYGLPFEPEDIVKQTIYFIEETQPYYVSLFTLVPYPGTDIWNNPKKYNIKTIKKDFDSYQHSVGRTDEELSWLPVIEYYDRTSEEMREERNVLKKYTIEWNKKMQKEN